MAAKEIVVWDTEMYIQAGKCDGKRIQVCLGAKEFLYLAKWLDIMTPMQESAHLHIWTLSDKSRKLF